MIFSKYDRGFLGKNHVGMIIDREKGYCSAL